MDAPLQVQLGEGRKLLIGGTGSTAGLAEVSFAGRMVEVGADALEKGLASLADLFGMLDKAVSAVPRRPESIEMEFKAKLTGECDLWVVSGEGEAEFTVKVTWGRR
jgi:hypothetical protein